MSVGQLPQATQTRQRHIALLDKLRSTSGDDVEYRAKLVQAHRALGNLFAARGNTAAAIAELGAAVSHADALARIEPDNRQWLQFGADSRLNFADVLLTAKKRVEAAAQTATACTVVQQLLARDPSIQRWRMAGRECQVMQAELAEAAGDHSQAMLHAQRAVSSAKSVKGSDAAADAYAVGRAYRLLGDIKKSAGDAAGARAAWASALAALPKGANERPGEMSERAIILERLGERVEAGQLDARLRAIGYQRT